MNCFTIRDRFCSVTRFRCGILNVECMLFVLKSQPVVVALVFVVVGRVDCFCIEILDIAVSISHTESDMISPSADQSWHPRKRISNRLNTRRLESNGVQHAR